MPDDNARATLHNVLKTARTVVAPAEAFPGWLCHVSLAACFVLLAEGQLDAAARVVAEFEKLDAELGCQLLQSPKMRATFDELRAEISAMRSRAEVQPS